MFDVDANGILSVTAKDTATGKGQKITITASSGSNEAEIQKMVTEAAEHEADDKVRREQVERRNKLDNCYTLEKTLRENKEKFQAADVSSLEALIKEGRDAVERQDDSVIAGVAERVEKEAHRLASAMYAGAGDTAAANEAAPKPPKDRGSRAAKNVVDAEFEDTPQDHP